MEKSNVDNKPVVTLFGDEIDVYLRDLDRCLSVFRKNSASINSIFYTDEEIVRLSNLFSGVVLARKAGRISEMQVDCASSGFPSLATLASVLNDRHRAAENIESLVSDLKERCNTDLIPLADIVYEASNPRGSKTYKRSFFVRCLVDEMIRNKITSLPVDAALSPESVAAMFSFEQSSARLADYYDSIARLRMTADEMPSGCSKRVTSYGELVRFSRANIFLEMLDSRNPGAKDGKGQIYRRYAISVYVKNGYSQPVLPNYTMTDNLRDTLERGFGDSILCPAEDMFKLLCSVKKLEPISVEYLEIGPFYRGGAAESIDFKGQEIPLEEDDLLLCARKECVARDKESRSNVFGGNIFKKAKIGMAPRESLDYYVGNENVCKRLKAADPEGNPRFDTLELFR